MLVKRLIKAIMIELLGKVNDEACKRCKEGKGSFVDYTSIKAGIEGS